ncbi:MAG: tetraacyldisaccharide 4'-kinase [Desulfobulbaceae bacterium A2]|nr:MAG: tetraacyldisaccharide 4'-kinase [Desulfobulbaceae bacterium A2]
MRSTTTSHVPDDSHRLLFALGRPLSPLYGALMQLRAGLYARNVLTRHRLPVPVISIGNLTLGGSGKTPLVHFLARELRQRGWHPAVISRGYGGKATGRINVVSDGSKLLLDAEIAGDEPRMLAELLPAVPVLTGVVRRLPALHAVQHYGADILLLDDGFQHLALQRDLDLVLFNADTLAGNSRVFPGGVLREPVKALRRCHAFVLTGVTDANRERATRFAALLQQRFPGRPAFLLERGETQLLRRDTDGELRTVALQALRQTPAYAFCGIARPESFSRSLQALGLSPLDLRSLADHQRYDEQLWRQLQQQATACGARALITTLKDFVKVRHRASAIPLYVLSQELREQPDFFHFVQQRLPRTPTPVSGGNNTGL